jgi:hypothetical protein
MPSRPSYCANPAHAKLFSHFVATWIDAAVPAPVAVVGENQPMRVSTSVKTVACGVGSATATLVLSDTLATTSPSPGCGLTRLQNSTITPLVSPGMGAFARAIRVSAWLFHLTDWNSSSPGLGS